MATERLTSKAEQKMWPKVVVPCDLADSLNGLTKEELTIIRQNLELQGMSSLRKQELVGAMADKIPEAVGKLLDFFDDDRYRLVKRIVDKDGWIKLADADLETIDYFLQRGVVFSGTYRDAKIFFVPQEVQKVILAADSIQYRRLLRKNTELIKLIHGFVYYYGVIGSSQLIDMIISLTGEAPEWIHFYGLLGDSIDYYEQIRWEYGYLCDYRVQDAQWVLREQQARPEIDYYAFTKGQLLQAGTSNYVDKTPALDQFLHLLRASYDLDVEELDEIADELLTLVNHDEQPGALLTYLGDFLEFPSLEVLQTFTSAVVDVANNSRKWILKGHTSKELSQAKTRQLGSLPSVHAAATKLGKDLRGELESNVFDIRTKEKIGRNDPCPCGSGKKFKKCCGGKD